MKNQIKFENKVIKPVFTDKRGDIFDILEGAKVGHIGMVTFSKGAVRGNHYHIKSVQYSYVVSGNLELTISDPDGKNKKVYLLKEGSLNVIPPKKVHTYKALSKSVMLDLTTLSRDSKGYEKDTIRV